MNRTVLISILVLAVAACDQAPSEPLLTPQVAFSSGGKGKTTSPTPTFIIPISGVDIAGDGKYASGGESYYRNGECGVHTTIFSDGSGDATMDVQADNAAQKKCKQWPRTLTVDWPGDVVDVDPGVESGLNARVNLGALGGTGGILAIDVHEQSNMPLNVSLPGSSRCTMLKFRDFYRASEDPSVGGRDVIVKRTSETTWDVWTPDDGATTGECTRPNGTLVGVNLAVAFTVHYPE
jgi:hypothetical protein